MCRYGAEPKETAENTDKRGQGMTEFQDEAGEQEEEDAIQAIAMLKAIGVLP